MSVEIKQVEYRRTIPPLTGARITRVAPITGKITSLIAHFPAGCNQLVSLRFGIEREGKGQVFPSPSETYLTLDDWTKEFALNELIEKGDQMWVDVLNADAANPHTPVVLVEIKGKGL